MGVSSDERLRDEDDVVSPQEDRERRMPQAGGKKRKIPEKGEDGGEIIRKCRLNNNIMIINNDNIMLKIRSFQNFVKEKSLKIPNT